jgi:hypothetical protein
LQPQAQEFTTLKILAAKFNNYRKKTGKALCKNNFTRIIFAVVFRNFIYNLFAFMF